MNCPHAELAIESDDCAMYQNPNLAEKDLESRFRDFLREAEADRLVEIATGCGGYFVHLRVNLRFMLHVDRHDATRRVRETR